MTVGLSVVLLDAKGAKALTKRIRQSTEALGELLLEAQEREAWRALGYRTWGAYVDGEFDFKRTRSYQVMKQAKVNRALAEAGSDVRATEEEARGVSTTVDNSRLGEQVLRQRAELKQKRPKRGIPDKVGMSNAISLALDNFDARAEGHEDEEILSYLTHEERRALGRAVTKARQFAERWGELLSRPIEVRTSDEWDVA